MGGGLSMFIPKSQKGSKRKDELDLVKAFNDAGYSVVKDTVALQGLAVSKNTKILGLFSGSHMPYHIDKADKVPSLSEMTAAAIKVLRQNPVKKGLVSVLKRHQ